MRNTNKKTFFLFYFHDEVSWTDRAKIRINFKPRKKNQQKNSPTYDLYALSIFSIDWRTRW